MKDLVGSEMMDLYSGIYNDKQADAITEEIPLREGALDAEPVNKDASYSGARKGVKWLIRHDEKYRHKLLRTVCLCWSFLANENMPALVDGEMMDQYSEIYNDKQADAITEEIPLREDALETETVDKDTSYSGARKGVKWLIRHDEEYRHKLLRTICLCWSFLANGWTVSQTGPSFLDLQLITSSTLEKASAFITAGSVGYLIGSIISGVLHNKIYGDLILTGCTFMNVVMTTIIPWCSIYEVMITAMLVRHTFLGAWDTVGNAELIQIWGQENMAYMQALHFCFAFGGIISPIVTAPFLITNQVNETNLPENVTLNDGHIVQNSGMNSEELLYNIANTSKYVNSSQTGVETIPPVESKLYMAYLTTSCISATCVVCFFVSYIISKRKAIIQNSNDTELSKTRKLPVCTKSAIVINLMFIMMFYVAVEETTMGFLATFCVKQFDWSKANGAYATSLLWGTFALGRFLGIFIIQYMKPSRMIATYILMIIFSFSGLLAMSVLGISAGVWIFIPISGFAMSIIFATVFTWTENELLPVTGRISSLFLIATSLGGVFNPLVIGTIMDTTPMFFCYLLLGESVLLLVLYIFASLQSVRLTNVFGVLHRSCDIIAQPK